MAMINPTLFGTVERSHYRGELQKIDGYLYLTGCERKGALGWGEVHGYHGPGTREELEAIADEQNARAQRLINLTGINRALARLRRLRQDPPDLGVTTYVDRSGAMITYHHSIDR